MHTPTITYIVAWATLGTDLELVGQQAKAMAAQADATREMASQARQDFLNRQIQGGFIATPEQLSAGYLGSIARSLERAFPAPDDEAEDEPETDPDSDPQV